MSYSTQQQELLRAIRSLEEQLQHVKELAEQAIPQKDWLTSNEFAKQTGLKPKTVSNYAGKGRFSRIKKNRNGSWMIHKSELTEWNL